MSQILFSQQGGAVTLALNRPPLNVVNTDMMKELLGLLKSAQRSKAKVLVLRGEGQCFSSGTDIKEHLPKQAKKLITLFEQACIALATLPIPTLAYVHGYALGGGLELACMCDLLYASPQTQLGQPEIMLGVMAPVASAVLPSICGRRAADLLFSGRPISAIEGRDWGLVNGIGDSVSFERVVQGIASKSRPALVAAKKAILNGRFKPLPAAIKENSKIYLGDLMKARDPEEGLKAFMEKRQPVWKDA